MELAALVALRLPPAVLGLASAKLSKVLSSLGYNVLEQLHLDPPQLLPCVLMSVRHARNDGPFAPEVHRYQAKMGRVENVRGEGSLANAGRHTSQSNVEKDDWVFLGSVGHDGGSAVRRAVGLLVLCRLDDVDVGRARRFLCRQRATRSSYPGDSRSRGSDCSEDLSRAERGGRCRWSWVQNHLTDQGLALG